jgi:hypothetical protein
MATPITPSLRRCVHHPSLTGSEFSVIVLRPPKQVTVRIVGDLDVRMPHQLLHPLRAETLFNDDRGKKVAKRV